MTHIVDIRGIQFALSHEHRGGLAPDPTHLWPAQDLIERVGGRRIVEDLIDDLYVRIERDSELNRVFPHFQTQSIKAFFVTGLGGEPAHTPTSAIGPFHRGTIVTRSLTTRWLQHMKAALKSSPIGPDAINELLHWLGPLANKLVNTDDLDVNEQPLMGSCNGVQTRQFVQRNALLAVAARGRLAEICEAVEVDPEVVSFRDSEGRSLLWKAASRNRVPLVEYLLQRGANIHLPACDPAVTNLACSSTARLGTPSRARVAKAVCSASS